VEVGRKENRTSEQIQVLGLVLQRKSHGQGTHERDGEEGKQGSGIWMGNRRKKEGRGDFRRRMMMFESMVESVLMYWAGIWEWKEQNKGRV
jgi:hypothetical protein